MPAGGLNSGTNWAGWPGSAPSRSSAAWTRNACVLAETIDSCSFVLRMQANISSMPRRSETWPSTSTTPRLASSQTSYLGESRVAPSGAGSFGGGAGCRLFRGRPDSSTAPDKSTQLAAPAELIGDIPSTHLHGSLAVQLGAVRLAPPVARSLLRPPRLL